MRVAVMIIALCLTMSPGPSVAKPTPAGNVSPPSRTPQPNNAAPESWADACAGHFLGDSGGMGFSIDVTKRPLRVGVRFADFGHITGRSVEAIAPGRLRVVDAETREIWLLSCRSGQVRLQPVNIPNQATLTVYRSTKALTMERRWGGVVIGSR